jgi:hypothetical protein
MVKKPASIAVSTTCPPQERFGPIGQRDSKKDRNVKLKLKVVKASATG